MTKLPARHSNRGVTLLEMVVVMGIVAIALALGVPSYKYVTNSNRVASEGNALLGDLQYARAEAIKEGQTVTACVSTNALTCAVGNNTWNSGWIIFSDLTGSGAYAAGDIMLRTQAAFTGTDTFTSSNNVAGITFNREGFAAGLANGTLISLHALPVNNQSTRCLSVSLVGLMAIQHYDGVTCL